MSPLDPWWLCDHSMMMMIMMMMESSCGVKKKESPLKGKLLLVTCRGDPGICNQQPTNNEFLSPQPTNLKILASDLGESNKKCLLSREREWLIFSASSCPSLLFYLTIWLVCAGFEDAIGRGRARFFRGPGNSQVKNLKMGSLFSKKLSLSFLVDSLTFQLASTTFSPSLSLSLLIFFGVRLLLSLWWCKALSLSLSLVRASPWKKSYINIK